MPRFLIALLSVLFFAAPVFAADRYEFDKAHTRILFFVNHAGFSDMVGEFTAYDGFFTFDPKDAAQSTIDMTLKPAGIRTSSAKLDEHLQTPDFFNTAQFPDIHFVSTGIKVTGENTGDVTGNLTMLGVTKPVVLHVHLNKADYHPITQDFMAGFSAEASLKRSDFGMTKYVPMVGDEVRLMVQTEGVDVDRKKLMEKKNH
jgi:polyisoprenoid-binding protein YceI